MQWLESTFANRFNRFRDERGHLFQSRYKALLDVSNGWLAPQLDIGSAAYVSKHLGLTRRKPAEPIPTLLELLNQGEGEA